MSSISIKRLQSVELFEGCRRSQLETIDHLGSAVSLAAGRILCREGDPGAEFFVLLEGMVEVERSGQPVARLHDGAWFGETALVKNTCRQAGITTLTPCVLIVFSRREFHTLCSLAPEVAARLEAAAEKFARGDEDSSWVWYQPIDTEVAMSASGTTS